MQMILPDGSVTYWPEWASTVPQNEWNAEQRAFMIAHQETLLRMQRERAERTSETVTTPIFGGLKLAPMTFLQERLVEHGVCPKCHTKTLAERHNDGETKWSQCATCLTIYGELARKLIG